MKDTHLKEILLLLIIFILMSIFAFFGFNELINSQKESSIYFLIYSITLFVIFLVLYIISYSNDIREENILNEVLKREKDILEKLLLNKKEENKELLLFDDL